MMPTRNAVSLAAALFAAGLASAQTTGGTASGTATQATTQSVVESPLVKAAREAAAKRGTKSRLSMTDKSVKKSAGKLIETTSKPLPPVPSAVDEIDKKGLARKEAADAAALQREAAEVKVGKLTKEVEYLSKELRRVEETYYDEDDPDFREDTIAKRFNDTKAKLEQARKDLDVARAASVSSVPTP